MTTHGHFHWNELLARDADAAKKFYSDLIGWAWEPMPLAEGGTYWVAIMDGKPVVGLFPTNRPGYEQLPNAWMSYLAVDDVDARTRKAEAAGAKLMKPIFDVPNVGRIAILTEPGGAGVGWITPAG